jgi:hypothetical protein
MKEDIYELMHFDEAKSIAIIRKNDEILALEPPFDINLSYKISTKPLNSKKKLTFDDKVGLKIYLQIRNAQYVSKSVRPLLQKLCSRPELIKGANDLQDFLEKFISEKLALDKPSPHLPLCVQIYRTLFGSPLFSNKYVMENARFLNEDVDDKNDKMLICQQILVMSKHEIFNIGKWIIPTLADIEHRWVPEERFEDIKNWAIYIDKFSAIELDPETRDKIKRIYQLSSQEAKRLKFIADGRHKVKEWQKTAPLHR